MDRKNLDAVVDSLLAKKVSVREAVGKIANSLTEEDLELSKAPGDPKSTTPDGKDTKDPDTLKDKGSQAGADKVIPVKQEGLELDKAKEDPMVKTPDGKDTKDAPEKSDKGKESDAAALSKADAKDPGDLEKDFKKVEGRESRWTKKMNRFAESEGKKKA
jgi:hypothetical protein